MPPFRMPDGTFINAANYAAATAIHKAQRAPAGPVGVAPPAAVQVVFTATITPVDPFGGRSLTKFGVGEEIDLGFTANPARTAASFGGLNWAVKSGPATLVNNPGNGGTARVTMGETAGAVVLELRTAGPAPAVQLTKTLWVVEPSGAVMTRAAGSGISHTNGYANAGFTGVISLRPIEVSFYRCQFREGSATPVATGSLGVTIGAHAATSESTAQRATTQSELAALAGARHPVMGTWLNVSTGHSVNGSHVIGTDNVQSAPLAPPFAAGTFNWPIPWLFRVTGSRNEKVFFTATHSEVVNAAGHMTISKAGCSVSCNAGDPSSTK